MRPFGLKYKLIPLTLLLGLQFCSNADPIFDPPGGKTFWALKIRGKQQTPYQVPAMMIGKSANAIVYGAIDDRNISDATADALLAAFENSIAPVEHTWFTKPLDVNGDSRVAFLLLDIDDGYAPGGNYIAGYFDPVNQYADADAYNQLGKRSNEMEMLYMDVYPSQVNSTSFLSTVAHEYQHLLQFSHNFTFDHDEDAWVDEGLSEISSDLTGYGPQSSRINYFKDSWDDSLIQFNNADVLSDYSMSYVYFRYLADIYGIGGISKIFKASQTGYVGVDTALKTLDTNLNTVGVCGDLTNLGTYSAFACSYRMMWGALLSDSSAATLQILHKNNAVSGQPLQKSVGYNFTTQKTQFDTAMANVTRTSASGSVSLSPYAAEVYNTNSLAMSCTSCQNFTIVRGTSESVIFNNSLASSFTASISGQVFGSGQEPPQNETSSDPLAETIQLETGDVVSGKKMHFLNNIPKKEIMMLQKQSDLRP